MTFKTIGDKKLDQPLSEIGAKGLFTRELEVALAKNKIDCAVHSLKDLPTDSPDGLEIVALLEREDPRDALVVNRATGAEGLDDLPAGSRVGTSSLRRRAQLMARRPDLEVVELRGNVPTRLARSRAAGPRGDTRRSGTHSPRGSPANHDVLRAAGVAASAGPGRDRHPGPKRRPSDGRLAVAAQ